MYVSLRMYAPVHANLLVRERALFAGGFVGYIILIVSRSPALSYFATYLAASCVSHCLSSSDDLTGGIAGEFILSFPTLCKPLLPSCEANSDIQIAEHGSQVTSKAPTREVRILFRFDLHNLTIVSRRGFGNGHRLVRIVTRPVLRWSYVYLQR